MKLLDPGNQAAKMQKADSVLPDINIVDVGAVCRKTPIKREPKRAFWNISEKKMRKMQRRGRDGYHSTFFLRIF